MGILSISENQAPAWDSPVLNICMRGSLDFNRMDTTDGQAVSGYGKQFSRPKIAFTASAVSKK